MTASTMIGKNQYAILPFHPPLAAGDEVPGSLRDEVRLLSLIQHPNVIRPVSIGESSDGSHLVVERVDGASLEQSLAGHIVNMSIQSRTARSSSVPPRMCGGWRSPTAMPGGPASMWRSV